MSAVVATTFGVDWEGWFGVVMRQPAAVTVPMAFATMIVVSVLTRSTVPKHVNLTMVRLHAPEHIDLDRGSFHPDPSRAVQRSPESVTARRDNVTVRRG